MKTFDQFIIDWTGKGVDTDGAFGFQCMDLMHKYCQEVLGLADLRILASPNARTVYLNFPNVFGNQLFEKIPNTPTGVPIKGDIMFYGNAPDGHVDMFIEGNVNNYRAFSQNLPTGSKSVVINHPNYANVLGWLRLKPVVAPPPDLQKQLDETRKQRDDNWNLYQKTKTEFEEYKKTSDQQITDLSNKVITLQSKIDKAKADLV